MSTGRCPRGFQGHAPTSGPHHTSWLSLLMFCFISSASIIRAGPPASVPAGEDTDSGRVPCQASQPQGQHSGLAGQLLAVPEVGESLAALGGGSTLKQKVCGSDVPPLSSIPSTTLEQEGVRVALRHPLTPLPPSEQPRRTPRSPAGTNPQQRDEPPAHPSRTWD